MRSKTFKIVSVRITYFKKYKSIAKEVYSVCGLMAQVPFYIIFLSEYIFQVESGFFFLIIIKYSKNMVGQSIIFVCSWLEDII